MEHIKDFFSQLFTSLDTTDSIVSLLLLAVSFLIGILTGWISRGSKVRRLKKDLAERDGRIKNLDIQLKAAQNKYNAKETELENTMSELEDIQDTNRRLIGEKQQLGNEKMRLSSQLQEATKQVEKLHFSNQEFISTNDQYIQSSQQYSDANKQQGIQIEELKAEIARLKLELNILEEKNKTLNENASAVNVDLEKELLQSKDNTQRILAVEARLNELHAENNNLKAEINHLSTSGIQAPSGASTFESSPIRTQVDRIDHFEKKSSPAIDSVMMDMDDESPEARSARARAEITSALGIRVKRASANEKDDLKQINGIGPFIEEKLNAIGLYTYEQMSQLDEELVDRVTDAIQFFPGRIRRDDWVGQAAKLYRTKLG